MKTFFNMGIQSLKGAFYAALFEETRPATNHGFLETPKPCKINQDFSSWLPMKAFLCFSAQSLEPNFSYMQLQSSQWIKIQDEFGTGDDTACA